MNVFQIIVLATVLIAMAWELWTFSKRSSPWASLLRLAVWAAALAVVYQPDLASHLAQLVGIGRGADFVLYCASLALLLCVFYLYARQVTLERRLTELVRIQALQQARRGRSEP